jgi:hypothetical protein
MVKVPSKNVGKRIDKSGMNKNSTSSTIPGNMRSIRLFLFIYLPHILRMENHSYFSYFIANYYNLILQKIRHKTFVSSDKQKNYSIIDDKMSTVV